MTIKKTTNITLTDDDIYSLNRALELLTELQEKIDPGDFIKNSRSVLILPSELIIVKETLRELAISPNLTTV